jgi:hypothetical protein
MKTLLLATALVVSFASTSILSANALTNARDPAQAIQMAGLYSAAGPFCNVPDYTKIAELILIQTQDYAATHQELARTVFADGSGIFSGLAKKEPNICQVMKNWLHNTAAGACSVGDKSACDALGSEPR